MNDGGAAFPWQVRIEPNSFDPIRGVTTGPKEVQVHANTGMSLRDYFAAAVMQGYLASFGPDDNLSRERADKGAEYVYIIADAMIAERSKSR